MTTTKNRRPTKRFSFLLAILAYIPFEIALSLLGVGGPLAIDMTFVVVAWLFIHDMRGRRWRRSPLATDPTPDIEPIPETD